MFFDKLFHQRIQVKFNKCINYPFIIRAYNYPQRLTFFVFTIMPDHDTHIGQALTHCLIEAFKKLLPFFIPNYFFFYLTRDFLIQGIFKLF